MNDCADCKAVKVERQEAGKAREEAARLAGQLQAHQEERRGVMPAPQVSIKPPGTIAGARHLKAGHEKARTWRA